MHPENIPVPRFGASRLLLPVNVCCANIAFFGDFFIFRFTFEGVRFPDRSKGLLRTYPVPTFPTFPTLWTLICGLYKVQPLFVTKL